MIETTDYLRIFLLICMTGLAICAVFCLIRAIKGPRFADRIMAANMISTDALAFIVLLSIYMHEDFVIDTAIIYAVLGFIATAVFSKIVIAREKKHRLKRDPDIVDYTDEEVEK